MRQNDDVFVAQQGFVGEVCDISCDDAFFNGVFQCVVVHQTASGKVQKSCAFFGNGKELFVKGVSGFVIQWNVDGDVIAFCHQFFQCFRFVNGSGQMPSSFQCQEGVIAYDVHA